MEERTQAVDTFVTHLYCRCGGMLRFTGKEIAGNPVKFQYQCEKCQVRQISPTRYPFISHRPQEKKKA